MKTHPQNRCVLVLSVSGCLIRVPPVLHVSRMTLVNSPFMP